MAVVRLRGNLRHQFVRLAQEPGISSVIDCDLGSGVAVLIDPLRVCGLEPDAAQGGRTAQYITLISQQGRGVRGGIADGVEQKISIERGGVLFVEAVHHMHL